MKSYLEARQKEDIRRDLASRLLPTDGPYELQDRVSYWKQDPSKFKKRGYKPNKMREMNRGNGGEEVVRMCGLLSVPAGPYSCSAEDN